MAAEIASPTGIAPVLQVHPTRRCNLHCLHCYTSSSPQVDEALPWQLLHDCVADAARLGYRQLAVSGGEPLLYQRLPELLAHARRLGMLTSLTTNGMLATPERWQALAPHLDVAAISIDGRPDEHDIMRDRAGAFARTMAMLPTIRTSGVPFGFLFTLTQHNVDSLEFIVDLAVREGAHSVQVHPLTLYGRAADKLPGDRPDAVELSAALAEAAWQGRQRGIAVQVDVVSQQQMRAYRHHLVPVYPVRELSAAAPLLIVQSDGAVVPLTHDVSPALWLGSLHQGTLAELAWRWLASGKGDQLAHACSRAWRAACEGVAAPQTAVYWYDEVAAQTNSGSGLANGHRPIRSDATDGPVSVCQT